MRPRSAPTRIDAQRAERATPLFSSWQSMLGVFIAVMIGSCRHPGTAPLATRSSPVVTRAVQAASRWLVIAPHPDDESLMGSGVLLRAIESGAEAAVIVVTNGDLDCLNDGVQRQGEAVAALSVLGLPEERAFFLGYPDGALALLGRSPLPLRARMIDHGCVRGNTTYGVRGFGRRDYHSVRFGAPAPYTRDNAESDLAILLDQLRPTDVVVSHPDDTHPDHVATYSLFRSALDRIIDVLPEAPRVHRAMVHNGDCWPTGDASHEPCPAGEVKADQPQPPLSGRLSGYVARERITVPESCRVPDPTTNPKVRAIAAHASQTRNSSASYLFSFVRSDEAFYPERLGKSARHWRRVPQSTSRQMPSGVGAPTSQNQSEADNPRPVRIALEKRLGVPELALFDADVESLSVPLAISLNLLRPHRTDRGSVTRLALLGDASGTYVLTLDADRTVAALSRTFAGDVSTLLHEWPLPHDIWQGDAAEAFTLAIEAYSEDGPTAELTLYCRDDIVGVVTDVWPRLHGKRLALSNASAVDSGITIWTTSKSAAVAAHGACAGECTATPPQRRSH